MAVAVTITKITPDGIVSFNLTLSGNYVAGGDVVDFTKATVDASFVGSVAYIPTSTGPINFDVWDAGGNIANGVQPIMGTTQSNNKVKITTAFNTELGAGAYSAALLAAKLQGMASFNKFL